MLLEGRIKNFLLSTHCDKVTVVMMVGEIARGKIFIHRRGFAFVDLEHEECDVFIPPMKMKNAITGDLVEVKISSKNHKGLEGEVTKILSSSKKNVVGIVASLSQDRAKIFIADAGGMQDIVVDGCVKPNDRVLLKIKDCIDGVIHATPIKNFGSIEKATLDVDVAIEEFGIKKSFPQPVLDETKCLEKITPKGRRDFRNKLTFTIDPDDALDYDDAISICRIGNEYEISIHISDVAHFVPEGSATDKEALNRCNSTYFNNRVVPMLPEILSEDLCSLKEGIDRYTTSVTIRYNKRGDLLSYDISKGIINSNKRFTYNEAKEILDENIKSKYSKNLQLLKELFKILKKKNNDRGILSFSTKELKCSLGKDGVPESFVWEDYDITHQMIEVFMIATNEIVAKDLIKRGLPILFRIHERPDKENLREFSSFCNLMGYQIPKDPSIEDIRILFESADKDHYDILVVGYVRSMKWAFYSKNNLGHYGLSLEHYTHFTSPIRRYCDLFIHRMLFLNKSSCIDIDKIAQMCSECERKSFKCENSVSKLKKIRYISKHLNKGFSATIKKIKGKFIYFDIDLINLEGSIPIAIGNKRPKHRYLLGDKIEVRAQNVDLISQMITWKASRP